MCEQKAINSCGNLSHSNWLWKVSGSASDVKELTSKHRLLIVPVCNESAVAHSKLLALVFANHRPELGQQQSHAYRRQFA